MSEGIKCKECGGRIMSNKCVNCGTVFTKKQIEEMANADSKQVVHKKLDLKMSRVKSDNEKSNTSTSSTKQNKVKQAVHTKKNTTISDTKKVSEKESDVKINSEPVTAKRSSNRLAQQTKSLKKEAASDSIKEADSLTHNANTTLSSKKSDTKLDVIETKNEMEVPEAPEMEIPEMEIPEMEIPEISLDDEVNVSDIETNNEDYEDEYEDDEEYENDGFEDVGVSMSTKSENIETGVDIDDISDDEFSEADDESDESLTDIEIPEEGDSILNVNEKDEPDEKLEIDKKNSHSLKTKTKHMNKEGSKEDNKDNLSAIDKFKKNRALSKARKLEQTEGNLDYDFNSDGFYDDVELADKTLPSYFSKRDFINALGFVAFMIGATILLIYNV